MKRRFPLLHYIATWSCKYAWQSFKNCIKLLLGRKLFRDEQLVFFRQYILHRIGLQRIWAVTCATSSIREGAGSLASLTMCTINFARVSGLTYLHTPLSIVGHADRPMQEWAAAWESFFSLGAGEEPCNGRRRGVIDAGHYELRNLDLCFGLRQRKKELQDGFRALIPEFRRKYYLNKAPRTTEEITVALHIRRGDVSAHQNSAMYTSTEEVLRIAGEVKAILDANAVPHSISVYSQANPEDFEQLSPLRPRFFLNADALWTVQELIEADILIISKGNFSYYAGVISDGIKIYEQHTFGMSSGTRPSLNAGLPALPLAWSWSIFSELDDWLPYQTDGTFDRATFERQLSLLLLARKMTPAGGPVRRDRPAAG